MYAGRGLGLPYPHPQWRWQRYHSPFHPGGCNTDINISTGQHIRLKLNRAVYGPFGETSRQMSPTWVKLAVLSLTWWLVVVISWYVHYKHIFHGVERVGIDPRSHCRQHRVLTITPCAHGVILTNEISLRKFHTPYIIFRGNGKSLWNVRTPYFFDKGK